MSYTQTMDHDDAEYGYGEYESDEPYLDEVFEFESAMASAGWGTDEDYGYFGGDEGDY